MFCKYFNFKRGESSKLFCVPQKVPKTYSPKSTIPDSGKGSPGKYVQHIHIKKNVILDICKFQI